MVKLMNPFRKRTGIFPSYFTGREDELNELREIYESTREGAAGYSLSHQQSPRQKEPGLRRL
jgi:hypothetical protein